MKVFTTICKIIALCLIKEVHSQVSINKGVIKMPINAPSPITSNWNVNEMPLLVVRKVDNNIPEMLREPAMQNTIAPKLLKGFNFIRATDNEIELLYNGKKIIYSSYPLPQNFNPSYKSIVKRQATVFCNGQCGSATRNDCQDVEYLIFDSATDIMISSRTTKGLSVNSCYSGYVNVAQGYDFYVPYSLWASDCQNTIDACNVQIYGGAIDRSNQELLGVTGTSRMESNYIEAASCYYS